MSISLPLMTAHANLFRGKRVLLRLDLNVPLLLNDIRSDFRIRTALPTINFLRTAGAKIIILSHVGKGAPEDTLKPVADYFARTMPIVFLERLTDPENQRIVSEMKDGDIAMLENVRQHKGETTNDPEFVELLASLGDLFVNDAFADSHRAHASIVGLAKRLPSFAGMRLAEEAAELSRAFDPPRPFLFIMGGGKIPTKMPLLSKLSERADRIFLGGIVANNFLKAKGYKIGLSQCDGDHDAEIQPFINNPKFITPTEVVLRSGGGDRIAAVADIDDYEAIVDIGRETITALEQVIGEAKFIVWNGPLGYYEHGYSDASRELLERISGSGAYAIIGGGDTVALVESMGNFNRFGFVSTGGGAMLEYLANETLVGLEALRGISE